jgi:thiol:disulfide interchange protein
MKPHTTILFPITLVNSLRACLLICGVLLSLACLPAAKLDAAGYPDRESEGHSAVSGFDARSSGKAKSRGADEESYFPKNANVEIKGRLVRADGVEGPIAAGDRVLLEITAIPDPENFIYAYEPYAELGNATLFAITETNDWNILPPFPNQFPDQNEEMGYGYHRDPVTWTFEIEVPDQATGSCQLGGMMGFQICRDTSCQPPQGARFSVSFTLGEESVPLPVFFSPGVSFVDVQKLTAERSGGKSTNGDSGKLEALVDTPELIAEMERLYDPQAKIKYLLLSEMDSVPVGSTAAGEAIVRKDMTFALAALGIFLGGLLLNLMPCVFPVLGLKVLGFVEQAGSDMRKVRIHGLVFTLGLLFSMWVLAGIVLTLKYTFGRNVSWGAEQMGNPYFVGSIIVLLFLLGLNMVGVFEFGTSMTRVGGNLHDKKGYSSSFMTGILTTLIATPCSGPFLGAAMSYTLAQESWIAMILFTIFGLGIALPYLVLSFFPSMISVLPRPGAWMHTFKVIMAFALFAAVAFFLRVFGGQTGVDGLSWLVMALVILAIAAFFYGTWSPAYVPPLKRWIFGWTLPALIFATGMWMGYDAAGQQNPAAGLQANAAKDGPAWQKWHPGKVEYMLANQPSIIWTDYTALWCPTCLFNKSRIFSNKQVLEKLEKLNVQLIKIDDTEKDPRISRDLARSDRSIIPVNIVYPPNYPHEPAILLEELISPADALRVLERMEEVLKSLE